MLYAALLLAVAADQVAQSHVDFSPLIPVFNGLITAIAGFVTLATPILTYYGIVWLRNHGIAVSAKAQGEIVARAAELVQKGRALVTQGADDYVENKLIVRTPSKEVETIANFTIAQAPELLAKMGIDLKTEEGQQKLIRFVLSNLVPTPPPADVNVTVTNKEEVK